MKNQLEVTGLFYLKVKIKEGYIHGFPLRTM
jgi:hypothetical protein